MDKDPITEPTREEAGSYEERIDELRGHLEKDRLEDLRAYLEELGPEDVAEVLSEFSIEEKLKIFSLLDPEKGAVVLDDTDPRSRLQILQKTDSRELAKVLGEMPVDEVVDVIEDVPEKEREEFLDLIEKEDAEEVEEILGYPEDSAARVMNPEFVSVREEDDVEAAIQHIRSLEVEEEVYYVYVVSDDMKLRGVVPLKKLLLSPRGTLIKDIAEKDIRSVRVDTDREEAALIMRKYDLSSLPVVDEEEKLVGRITVDDIIDVVDEEYGEDISKMTGTIEEEWGTETTLKATQNRLPWLITCMLGSIVTGLVIQMFEVTLLETIALVSFIPVITATGGNSGVQASTVVVRGIALGHMDFARLGEEIWRQLKIALGLGVVCGILLSILANAWKKNPVVGLIVGMSIFLVVVWSNFVGVFVPMVFKKMRIDPAIASGPFITTFNDIIGVFIYLTVASVLLR
ncbi:MAG: magnesium transporter [Candidatus Omnitrophota bacterium]|jgi:magnesium transporter